MDTVSKYAPDFREKKFCPLRQWIVAKARVGRCWLLVTVLRQKVGRVKDRFKEDLVPSLWLSRI